MKPKAWCFGVLCLKRCPLFLQKYKEYEKDVAIEEIDGLQLVKKLAKNMEEMFHKKSEAVRVSPLFLLCVARGHKSSFRDRFWEPSSQGQKWMTV